MKQPLCSLFRPFFKRRASCSNLIAKKLSLVLTLIVCSGIARAQLIKGKIYDAATGEPLIGATVKIEQGDFKQFTSARLDGSYSFKALRPGDYKLTANYIGYKDSKEFDITIKSANDAEVQNIILESLSSQLTEVVVSAQADKTSDKSARNLEKQAPSLENILSQNTIQLLPDVTVGNALQRVSGVTVQRTSTGEGRYAIIRGMDQRYNNTLVNGIQIPSPDDKFRFVPMDIFPSEMLERLEVIKTLIPSMEADATGGTMNLVMKSAPDRFILDVNASGGFSTLFSSARPFTAFSSSGINDRSPAQINGNSYAATYANFNNSALTSDKSLNSPVSSTVGLTIGDRFLNGKLGILISASDQNTYRGSNSTALIPSTQPNIIPAPNTPDFTDAIVRQYSTQEQRLGIHNKIDYVFNKKNKISLYTLYLHTDEYQSRMTADTDGLGLNSTAAAKQVTIENRSTFIKQTVYNNTLHGDHWLSDNLKFNWDAVYSIANRNEPDRTTFDYDENPNYNSMGELVSDVENNTQLEHHWESNSDRDLSAYANLIYNHKLLKRNVEFSAGGMFRYKTRDAYYISYQLNGGNSVYSGNVNAIPFAFQGPTDGIGSYNSALTNDYTETENINAEYLQAKVNFTDRLSAIGGVRIENTYQNYNTQEPYNFSEREGTIIYSDVLPSVNLKYELTDDQNLRGSYFESISRPGFGEIVPYNIEGEYYTEIGNPYLKHSTADNYDLRYEFFPGGADQFLLGTFYKDIQNPIEYFVVRGAGPSDQYIQPQNAASGAVNYGLEAVATKYFGVLGVSANYTYTHSSITTNKLLYYNDQTLGLQQKIVEQTRPLQGQADNTGNLSVLFKSEKIGLDMQLAFVYTGERIAQVSAYYDLDFYDHPYSQLDFSFEKTIVKKLSFYGKVNNLTNSIAKIYLKYPHGNIDGRQQEFLGPQDIASETLVQSDMYKIFVLGGLRYKL